MSQFRYSALSATGEALHGQLEAASVAEVISRLQEQGHIPLEAVPAGLAPPGSALTRWWRRGPIDGATLVLFTHQLATLLAAGQALDRALGVLAGLADAEPVRKLVERIRERVRGGSTLSFAMEEEHGVFSRLYLSLVRAGEAGGTLEDSLYRLAEYLERAQALRGNVINALIYPAFLVAGVFGSLVLLLAYVVPQFVPIFADMQVPIPWITRVVLWLGSVVQNGWWLIGLLLVAAVLVWRARMRDPAHRLDWHRRMLQWRGFGPLRLKLETSRLTRTLGTLLKNGVPLLSALQVAREVSANLAVIAAVDQVMAEVRDGAGLGSALSRSSIFPPLAIQMIQVGEESGQLDGLLLKVADTFEDETRRSIDRLLAALVPALTIVMTVLVAIIMAAILMPLLSLTSNIQ